MEDSKKIKVIHLVNPNGLGHLRRALFIWDRIQHKFDLKILIDSSQKFFLNYFIHKLHDLIETRDFSGMITLKNLDNPNFYKNYINFHKNILDDKAIKSSDLIISDNTLIDFHKLKKKGYILGSFLWKDIIENKKIIELENTLISNNDYCQIGIDDFILTNDPLVKLLKTGWYVNDYEINNLNTSKKTILFSGGLGKIKREYIKNTYEFISKHKDYSIKLNKFYANVLGLKQNFFFEKEDWKDVFLIIGRPGLGTISDCIESKIPMVAIGEVGNDEISFNSQKLKNKKIGFDYVGKNLDEKIFDISNINFSRIRRSGVDDFLKIIYN